MVTATGVSVKANRKSGAYVPIRYSTAYSAPSDPSDSSDLSDESDQILLDSELRFC